MEKSIADTLTQNETADKIQEAKDEIRRRTGTPQTDLAQIERAADTDSTIQTSAYINETARQNQGASQVSYEVAERRARSAYRTQQIKTFQDQYSTYTRDEMQTELQNAVDSYNPGNQETEIRLEAALSSARGKGLEEQTILSFIDGGIVNGQTMTGNSDLMNGFRTNINIDSDTPRRFFQTLQNSGGTLPAALGSTS